MGRRFWISGATMFIAALLLGFVIHGTLLEPEYQALGALYRDEPAQMARFPYMVAAYALMGLAITWIYRRGAEPGKPRLGQGLRFGLAMALLAPVPWYLIYYAVQPLPAALVLKQIVLDTLGMLLLGVLAAFLNPAAPSDRP